MRCDGFSEEEIERHDDLCIQVHGFLMQQVYEQPRDERSWTYTIGLIENFGHPELLCVQISANTQAELVHALGTAVVENGELPAEALQDLDVELRPVHEDHLDGDLVASWRNRYAGRPPARGEFLQVVPGPSWFCRCHEGSVQHLDDPTPLII